MSINESNAQSNGEVLLNPNEKENRSRISLKRSDHYNYASLANYIHSRYASERIFVCTVFSIDVEYCTTKAQN